MEKWAKFVDKLFRVVDNFVGGPQIGKKEIGILIIINLGQGLVHPGYLSYPHLLGVINRNPGVINTIFIAEDWLRKLGLGMMSMA